MSGWHLAVAIYEYVCCFSCVSVGDWVPTVAIESKYIKEKEENII